MSNFKFISYNENVKKILKQLKANESDWKAVWKYENIGGDLTPPGFLPLIMAVVKDKDEDPKDTELLQKTPMFEKYSGIFEWLNSKQIYKISRCAFFRLAPGKEVGRHIDEGAYYLTKDRYHLSIQGEYLYECDGEEHIIKPGTFFWFNNKKIHSAKNISNIDRITFVFDTPHSPTNPHHKVK